MSYLWDSNILSHYLNLNAHPQLYRNLEKISRSDVMLPVIVVAEVLRGRADAITKSEIERLARAQELFQRTYAVLDKFQILYFDDDSISEVNRLRNQVKTRKRYADFLIAAQARAGNHILVTRNKRDFRDLLPPNQLQNWIDEEAR